MEKEVNKTPVQSVADTPAAPAQIADDNISQNSAVDASLTNAVAASESTPLQPARHVRVLSEGARILHRRAVSLSLIRVQPDADDTAGEKTAFRGSVTVHARYRHRPTSSQGSFSALNGSQWSASHSRMSSREQLSWDISAWKEVTADIGLPSDQTKEYLRFGRFSNDDYVDSEGIGGNQRIKRHARSLAAWDRSEVEAFGKDDGKNTPVSNTERNFVSPIGKKEDSCTESIFETAPLGHQQTFSLLSHKDATQSNREDAGETEVQADTEGTKSSVKCPIMTHVIVNFKFLYGVYYVPKSEWGKFNIGELVSVESHTGENTGRVVCDLTDIMKDKSLMPANIAALREEVLCPEDASQPLETLDPITNKETLLRLPRIIRRGMNKGKKRLYYARRRDTEAYNVCQRLIRERGFSFNVSAVEYQVDFKRLTVYCSGSSSNVNPNELMTFTQELAMQLRGSAVEVLFSSDSLASLEVTRSITNGAFNLLYQKAMAEGGAQGAQGANTRTPPLQPQGLHLQRPPCHFSEVPTSHMGTQPVIPLYNVPSMVQPRPQVLMTPPMGVNPMYDTARAPPLGWGWPTLPPYIAPPHVTPSMGGRM